MREVAALSLAQHTARLQALMERPIANALNPHGLSSAELDVLGALMSHKEGGIRPGELSSRLLLTTGGLSNILRRLKADELIERRVDARDGRSYTISLTSKGRVVAREAGLAVNAVIDQLLEDVDSEVLQSASQLMHRVLAELGEDLPVHYHSRR